MRLSKSRSFGGATAVAAVAAVVVGVAPAPAPASVPDNCPNAAIRAEQGTTHLPECRAYEMVTPPDKGGAFTSLNTGLAAVPSSDGSRFLWSSLMPAEGTVTPLSTVAVASRGAGGWSSQHVSPAPVAPHPFALTSNLNPQDIPDDASSVIFSPVKDNFDPADQNPSGMIASPGDAYQQPVSGDMTLISRGNQLAHTFPAASAYAGISADGSHVLFSTQNKLLDVDAARVRGSGIYDRVAGQTVEVGLADDETLLNPCGASLGGAQTSQTAVSAPDASRIFFESPARDASASAPCNIARQVYVRIDGERTVHVSRSRLAVPETPRPAEFHGAAVDGSIVYVISAERLVEDAPVGTTRKLYAYDVAADELRFVADDVRRVIKVSRSGETFAYTRETVISVNTLFVGGPQGEKPVGLVQGAGVTTREVLAQASLSPSGRYLAFVSGPNVGTVNQGEAYRYDYDTGELLCVSCRPDGVPPDSRPAALIVTFAVGHPRLRLPGSVTDAGSVFFSTSHGLVPEDGNANEDVYEFSGGRVALISGGTGSSRSRFLGLSDDGDSAFFWTTDSLTVHDVDNGDADVYAARVDGGFPAPAAPAPPCRGDACQGGSAAAPTLMTPASGQFMGRGNVTARVRAALSVARLSSAQRRALARGRKVRLRVRVNRPGKVSAKAQARLGRRTLRIASGRTSAKKAGVVRVTLRLSRAARKRLATGRRLKASLIVRFAGVRSSRTVVLKRGRRS